MINRIVKTVTMVVVMFLGTVIVIKLIADAFARFVLWTARIWGMEYR